MPDFADLLRSRSIILMDGAMGSELRRAGLPADECCELWNLTRPDQVRAVHRAYRAAGAQCLVTNTFQANPDSLARWRLDHELERINQTALDLARSEADGVPVLASIGWMNVTANQRGFARVVRSLAGADALLLETWSGDFEFAVRIALEDDVNTRRLPVLLSLTYTLPTEPGTRPRLITGQSPAEVAVSATKLGIAALGVNCGREIGIKEMATVLRDYRAVTDLPLLARPNAGTPVQKGGTLIYPRDVEDMATQVGELFEAGVQLIGGCCGTTPAHIAAFAASLQHDVERGCVSAP
jgi:5-methyltetrahydrofolate--homocysteine methyltransferase